ncbi:Slp family lipoprotein [Pasteurella sp. WM03]|uniref:Slp family lipoprotein n=1 Tax=Pasteurella sp. WM03 TaxID=2558280 RepID=UPI0032AF0B0E
MRWRGKNYRGENSDAKKIGLFLTALLGLTACVSAPKGLETENFTRTDLMQIQTQDYACACHHIRLGGKVIRATALENQTELEILNLPVSSLNAKPLLEAHSNGRFIAYIEGFIDPEVVKNQYITLGGILKKQQVGKVDQAEYVYPVINVKNYRLWKVGVDYYSDYDENWRFYRAHYWRNDGFYLPQIRYYLY